MWHIATQVTIQTRVVLLHLVKTSLSCVLFPVFWCVCGVWCCFISLRLLYLVSCFRFLVCVWCVSVERREEMGRRAGVGCIVCWLWLVFSGFCCSHCCSCPCCFLLLMLRVAVVSTPVTNGQSVNFASQHGTSWRSSDKALELEGLAHVLRFTLRLDSCSR